MSLFSKDKLAEIDAEIRMLRVMHPGITAMGIAEKTGYTRQFVSKRLNKIAGEAARRLSTETVQAEIEKFEGINRLIEREMTAIIADPKMNAKAKAMAAKVLIEGKNTLIGRKFDAGMFSKPEEKGEGTIEAILFQFFDRAKNLPENIQPKSVLFIKGKKPKLISNGGADNNQS